MKLAAVDKPRDDFMHVIRRAEIVGDDAVEFVHVIFGWARFACPGAGRGPARCGLGPSLRWGTRATQMRNNIAHNGQGMFVILGDMIDHARLAAMQIAAA